MMRISDLGRVAAIALFALMGGCGRERVVNQAGLPQASKQQEALALSGVNKLRGLFNKGECQAIFHEAAFAGGAYSQERWLDDCAQLREEMGAWNSFAPSLPVACEGSGGIVCIDGVAQFEKGSHRLELGWLLNRGSARLVFLELQAANGPILIPPLPQKLIDWPPSRNGKDVAQILQRHSEPPQS